MINQSFTPFDLWYADFPLEEDLTQHLNRPVIILNVEPLEVLSVKVTSTEPRDKDKFDIPIVEWQYAGLKNPSTARISKTMFLTNDKFTKRIGTLHKDDVDKISETYIEYIQSTT